MEGGDREKYRWGRVYSSNRIRKATEMTLSHIKDSNSFRSFHPRIIIKHSDKIHYLNRNKKTKDWQCSCWWDANRAVPNLDRWGYCADVLALLLHYDKKRFYKEIQRITCKEETEWKQ